jgi:hypothetical protein
MISPIAVTCKKNEKQDQQLTKRPWELQRISCNPEEKPAAHLLQFSCSSMAVIFSANTWNELRETLNETPHVLPKPLCSWDKILQKLHKGFLHQNRNV